MFQITIEGTGFSDSTEGDVSDHSNLRILGSKKALQILPMVIVQVKEGNTSEKILKEIRQIIYSLNKRNY